MATEDHPSGIPVSFTPDQTGLRLLELPSELCDLITSSSLTKLSLKSAAPASDASTSDPSSPISKAPPHAVLCTPTQTYQLRQVQTSNTVLITRPAAAPTTNAESPSQQGLSAFATCTSSLELTPSDEMATSNAKTISAEEWLNYLLPYYETFQNQDPDKPTNDTNRGQTPLKSKIDIFADIPFSDAECEMAWRVFGAFEFHGRAVKPTAKTLLQLWTSVFQSRDVAKPFNPSDLKAALEEADIPFHLLESVLAHLSSPSPPYDAAINMNEPMQLDKAKTVTWVGQIHYANKLWYSIEFARDPSAMTLDCWRSLLPESWSDEVTLDKFTELTYDRFKPPNAREGSLHPNGKTENPGGKRPGKKRDWHEKFKRTRTK